MLSPALCCVHCILKARQHLEGTDFGEPFELYFSRCNGCSVHAQILSYPIPVPVPGIFQNAFCFGNSICYLKSILQKLCCVLVLHLAPLHLTFHTSRMSQKSLHTHWLMVKAVFIKMHLIFKVELLKCVHLGGGVYWIYVGRYMLNWVIWEYFF